VCTKRGRSQPSRGALPVHDVCVCVCACVCAREHVCRQKKKHLTTTYPKNFYVWVSQAKKKGGKHSESSYLQKIMCVCAHDPGSQKTL